MIEIRTYEGDAVELSRFVLGVWRRAYQGRMPIALWDARYFDWQLLADRPGARDFLVGAYEGAKLVGFLGAEGFRFALRGRQCNASMASWTTAHPDYALDRIGPKLIREMRRRHLEHGALFSMGFAYAGSPVSMGPQFWRGVTKTTPILGKVGFWVRILDLQAYKAWEPSRLRRASAELLQLWPLPDAGADDRHDIRPYRSEDLADCLELTRGLVARVDLGYVWTPERLAHQLAYPGVPRTLVLERDGRVRGFVNYYRLEFLQHEVIEAGIIDLVAFGGLATPDRRRLLRAALSRMRADGLKAALLLRLPCYPWAPLLATGFVPMPADSDVVCVVMDPRFSAEGVKRLAVHWR